MKRERGIDRTAYRFAAPILVAILWMPLSCAVSRDDGPEATSSKAPESTRPDGLVEHPVAEGKLLVHPERGVDGYDEILVRRTGFRLARGQKPLSDSDRERLVELLTENRQAQIAGIDQLNAEEPGPCVVALDVMILDLELYRDSKSPGAQTTVVSSYGGFALVVELRDSLSNDAIASYAVRYNLGGGVTEGRARPDLNRVARLIDRTTRGSESVLRTGVPLTPMDARADLGCAGRVGQARRAALGG